MATTETFSSMLKRYMPYQLLVEEMKRRNYFWNKVSKDKSWKGGTLEIPFEGAEASSLQMGSLTAQADIAEAEYVMGVLSSQPELWGTMLFNEKDLKRHGDMKASYLKILPGKINQFITRMSERVSIQLLGDGSIAVATANGTISAGIAVDHPERFAIGEKVAVDDDDSAAVEGYVVSIDINTKIIEIDTTRTSTTAVDLSGYTTAQNAKVYLPGVQANGFTSLGSQLLSSTNGGSAALFGQTKTAYPHLQALNIDGSGYAAGTLLADVFGGFYEQATLGKGMPTEIVMSFDNFKNISTAIEGDRRHSPTEKKSGYGFRSVTVMGPDSEMTITAVRDMPNDKMYILDWDAIKFHGHNFFDRKRSNNEEFFVIRGTAGYQYVVDVAFQGDLVVNKPSHCAVIHSISL